MLVDRRFGFLTRVTSNRLSSTDPEYIYQASE
jgi:hypothetical protein